MDKKAQAGLEYLMTYAWALILIATIIGVLVFVVSGTQQTVVFSSSDSTKMMLKGASVSGSQAEIIMQNITGGKIKVESVTFSGDLSYSSSTKINGASFSFPMELPAGSEIHIANIGVLKNGDNSSMTIAYTDATGLRREAAAKSGAGGPAGIVAAYAFEESFGASITDNSGNMKPGTLINGALVETVGCKSGKCLRLDGSNDHVNISGTIGTGAYTKIAWIKLESGAYYNIVSSYSTASGRDPWLTSNHFWVYTSTGRKLNAGHGTAVASMGTQWYIAQDPVVMPLGEWHHVAVTFEPTAANAGTLIVYKDGKEVARATNVHFEPGIPPSEYTTYIGRWQTGAYYKGLIDEVKIFNKTLSASEIAKDYERYS